MQQPAQHVHSLESHGKLRVMFIITSMPIGGAEMLLVDLVRRLDRRRFAPQLCCLKEKGPLGEALSSEIPVHSRLLAGKYDVRILSRLRRLLATERIDAVVTVGAGDKMFWGRLAARWAGVPVICSALHSTGWPDGVGRLNRLLTPITDAFIGVAEPHARHLVHREGFPKEKVRIIPNGVDTDRFRPVGDTVHLRQVLEIPAGARVAGIVAALRPEKNHPLFLRAAADVLRRLPSAVFLIAGEGPERPRLERLSHELGLAASIRFLGNRADVPKILPLLDVFVLTSHNEANPVSILEAMSCERPVVATNVGSIAEVVRHGETGYLVAPGDRPGLVNCVVEVLQDQASAHRLGKSGREEVLRNWSLEKMVAGYENLISEIHRRKAASSLSYQAVRCADRMEISAR